MLVQPWQEFSMPFFLYLIAVATLMQVFASRSALVIPWSKHGKWLLTDLLQGAKARGGVVEALASKGAPGLSLRYPAKAPALPRSPVPAIQDDPVLRQYCLLANSCSHSNCHLDRALFGLHLSQPRDAEALPSCAAS